MQDSDFMRLSADIAAENALESLNAIIDHGRQTNSFKYAKIITTVDDVLKMAQIAMDSNDNNDYWRGCNGEGRQ